MSRHEPATGRPRGVGRRPVLGVLSVLAAGGAGTAAGLLPPPRPRTLEGATAVAKPGPTTVLCPGPVTVPDKVLTSSGDAGLKTVPPSDEVTVRTIALDPDSPLLFGRTEAATTRTQDDGSARIPRIRTRKLDDSAVDAKVATGELQDAVQTVPDLTHAVTVTATSSSDGPPVADVVQHTVTEIGDFRSRALTRATAPVTEAMFLGIGTRSGSSTALVLRNIGPRPATAVVQVWTAKGPASMGGSSRVVVAPGSTEKMLLEAVVPDQDAIGVRVATTGAPLHMSVQASERDGLTPGGVEILSPGGDDDRDLLIPGIRAAADADPEVQLLNTRGLDATTRVTVHGVDGPVDLPGLDAIAVPQASLVQVPLRGLEPGSYAVRVQGEVPLAAAARSVVLGKDLPGATVDRPRDFAVAPSTPTLDEATVLALTTDGKDGHLLLAALEDTELTCIPIGADGAVGKPVTRSVPAQHALVLDPSDLPVPTGEPVALALTPDVPEALVGAWISDGPTAKSRGPLLSILPLPQPTAATGTETALRIG